MVARIAFERALLKPELWDGNDLPHCYKCVVFDSQNRIPVLERHNGSDRWFELPGGKIRFGENEQSCVARELWEELGIRARLQSLIGAIQDPLFGTSDIVTFAHATLISGMPRNMLPQEHLALHLCTPQEAVEKLGTRIPPDVASFILARPAIEYARLPPGRLTT